MKKNTKTTMSRQQHREAQDKAQAIAAEATRLMKANVFEARKGQAHSKSSKNSKKSGSKKGRVKGRGTIGGTAYTPTAQGAAVFRGGLHVSAVKWAQGLEQPFTGTPQKCPWNFNPVPSYLSFVATTVMSQVGSNTLPATKADQWVFMPGHGQCVNLPGGNFAGTVVSDVADFDEVAYHYGFQVDSAATAWCWGPIVFADAFAAGHNPAAAMKSAGITIGVANNDSSVANTSGQGWNASVPFVGNLQFPGHARCKLLSMGIKFINTTPEQFRGGSFVSVQPVTVADIPPLVSSLTINPSYKDWGPDGCTVTWIPRLRDLAYWHPSTASVAVAGVPASALTTNSLQGPGIAVWVTNPSATAQTYDVECVAHWEISGFSVQTISTDAKGTYLSDSVLKSALSAQTNNAPTASGFVDTLHSAAGTFKAGLKTLGKVVPRAAPAAAAAGALI